MAESTDDNVRNVSTALMNAAPKMAEIQIGADRGNLHKYNLAKDVADAVKKLSALRDEGTPVNEYLKKQSMFDEYQDTDEMREVLEFLDRNKRSSKRIGQFLNKVADIVKAQGDPKQEQLFESEPLTERAIIAAARESVENGGSQDLFAGAESESSAKSSGNMRKHRENRGFSAFFGLSGRDFPKKHSYFGKFTANALFSRVSGTRGSQSAQSSVRSSSTFGTTYHLPPMQTLQLMSLSRPVCFFPSLSRMFPNSS